LADGRITGLVAVNMMRDVRVTRRLMEAGRIVPPELLVDQARPLGDLLKG
jgi:hypothetical protein